MDEINRQNSADGLPQIEIAIALNTGEVVAGNTGSERRSKYGFVGHEVNVTSRIGHATPPNEILVSERTLNCLKKEHFVVGPSRNLKPKGIEETLAVFPIIGGTPVTNAAVLLVEDNDINRDMLTRRLTRAGLTDWRSGWADGTRYDAKRFTCGCANGHDAACARWLEACEQAGRSRHCAYPHHQR